MMRVYLVVGVFISTLLSGLAQPVEADLNKATQQLKRCSNLMEAMAAKNAASVRNGKAPEAIEEDKKRVEFDTEIPNAISSMRQKAGDFREKLEQYENDGRLSTEQQKYLFNELAPELRPKMERMISARAKFHAESTDRSYESWKKQFEEEFESVLRYIIVKHPDPYALQVDERSGQAEDRIRKNYYNKEVRDHLPVTEVELAEAEEYAKDVLAITFSINGQVKYISNERYYQGLFYPLPGDQAVKRKVLLNELVYLLVHDVIRRHPFDPDRVDRLDESEYRTSPRVGHYVSTLKYKLEEWANGLSDSLRHKPPYDLVPAENESQNGKAAQPVSLQALVGDNSELGDFIGQSDGEAETSFPQHEDFLRMAFRGWMLQQDWILARSDPERDVEIYIKRVFDGKAYREISEDLNGAVKRQRIQLIVAEIQNQLGDEQREEFLEFLEGSNGAGQ